MSPPQEAVAACKTSALPKAGEGAFRRGESVTSVTVSTPSRTVKRTSSPAKPKPYTRRGSSW